MQLIDKLLTPIIYLLLGLAILLLVAAQLPAEDMLGDCAPLPAPAVAPKAPHKARHQAAAKKHHRARHHKHKAKPAEDTEGQGN